MSSLLIESSPLIYDVKFSSDTMWHHVSISYNDDCFISQAAH